MSKMGSLLAGKFELSLLLNSLRMALASSSHTVDCFVNMTSGLVDFMDTRRDIKLDKDLKRVDIG